MADVEENSGLDVCFASSRWNNNKKKRTLHEHLFYANVKEM
jgi:hypothetical protein